MWSSPQPLPREPVALRGNFSATSFARVLHELYRIQATGALFMMRDTVKKILYVDSGQPVSVKSNLLRECLGQILLERGRIQAAPLEAMLAQASQEKQPLGQILARPRDRRATPSLRVERDS